VNLYRYDTSSGATTYLATIGTEDYVSNNGVCSKLGSGVLGPSTSLCPTAEWYTSPDGRYLLFSSTRELTGDTTASTSACVLVGTQGATNGHCDALYRYDASLQQIACVSCGPSGAAPTSDATFDQSAPDGPASSPLRAMSDDGSFVFFQTASPLLPGDTNGTLDVYEWHNGQLSLLSAGGASGPSFFLDSTPDGGDVYIGTHARLVGEDTDSEGDVYDARVCSGADPCLVGNSSSSGECEGDTCQAAPPAPATQTLESLQAGNSGLGAPPVTTSVIGTAKVLTTSAKGVRFGVSVKVTAAGRLVLTGSGVSRVAKSPNKAGTVVFGLRLTPAAARKLRREHLLKVRLTLTYTGVGSRAKTSHVLIEVKSR
jgi:hypothetical protein